MINNITTFFQRIRVIDIVDIGIIAVFIFLILVWLKKSRVRFIFIGIIMMGALYILARLFGFYLTTVVLQAFFAVALITIVIIFQDDLRHFFERIAIFGVTRKHKTVTSFTHDIEVLSSALANLSRKKIGALIVIKGTDPLDRHLEAGVLVDGLISQVLLESIFDHHVPSHDGAVIVDGARLTKLGCHLPLSTNIKEVGRLGTRHAAGLGMTERTDALSIVVSEEEGTISVAEEGKFKTLKDAAHLNHTIQDFYRKKFPERKGAGLRRSLTDHLPEKLFAIVIACGLWATFGHRIENIQRDFVVPIEYRNLATDRIIDEPKAKEVNVTLGGNEQEFDLLKMKELKVSLDMADIKEGENKITLSKELVRNSHGLSVINIEPAQIAFHSYKLIPVTVDVELKTEGKPLSGVVILNMRVEPKSVSVMVPSTLARDKISLETEPIDLASITETTTLTSKIVASPDIRFSQDKSPELKAVIEVEKKRPNESSAP